MYSGLRAVIFDKCPLFRQAFVALLVQKFNLNDAVIAASVSDVETELDCAMPDFLFIDLDAGEEAVNLLRGIKEKDLPVKCVVMITDGTVPHLMTAIRMQADGFLSKREKEEELAAQIGRIFKGEMVISHNLTMALAVSLRHVPMVDDNRDIRNLSRRELEVLKCVATGLSNGQIAQRLEISEGTVKVHVKHVLKKLNFNTRLEAALWATESGYRGI